jgi:hypothetical protein
VRGPHGFFSKHPPAGDFRTYSYFGSRAPLNYQT